MLRNIFFIVSISFLIFGCAGKQISMETATGSFSDYNFLLEPHMTVGILETDSIKNKNITVIEGVFPEELFGEYFPGRIRWNVIGVDPNTGKEYFGQALFSGIKYDGKFYWTIVLDAEDAKNNISEMKVVVLSTDVKYVYDLGGEEFPVDVKFVKNENSRKEYVVEHGSKIGDYRISERFNNAIYGWNRYHTPDGTLLSPLSEKDVKTIASINPKYTYFQKLIGSANISVRLDYISTLTGIAVDMVRASNIPSEGWDYTSQLPSRRNMSFIIQYVLKLKQQAVDYINDLNKQLLTTKGR